MTALSALGHVVLPSIVSRSRSVCTSPVSFNAQYLDMPRFFTGDELGSVKAIQYSQDVASKEWKSDVTLISSVNSEAKPVPVQRLAFHANDADRVVSSSDTRLAVSTDVDTLKKS